MMTSPEGHLEYTLIFPMVFVQISVA